jgi:hypothetical protein
MSLIGDTPQVYRYFLREAPHCLSPRRNSRPQDRRALGPGQALPFQDSQTSLAPLGDLNRGRSGLGPATAIRWPGRESPPGLRRRPGWLPVSPDRGQFQTAASSGLRLPGASEAVLEALLPALRRNETVIERRQGCGSATVYEPVFTRGALRNYLLKYSNPSEPTTPVAPGSSRQNRKTRTCPTSTRPSVTSSTAA